MNKVSIIGGIGLVLVAGPALSQAKSGLKVGQTRDRAASMAEQMFKRFDQNADGSTDIAEVTSVLKERATKSGKTFRPRMAERTISRNDANSDGKVTMDEFKAAAAARFAQSDANKNAVIDADEGAAPTSSDDGG